MDRWENRVYPPILLPEGELAPMPDVEPGAVCYVETTAQRKARLRRQKHAAYMRRWRASRRNGPHG